MTDQSWRDRAQCLIERADPNLFVDTIHDEEIGARDARHMQAAEFCHRCPVKDPCLIQGRAEGEGVWGQRLMPTHKTKRGTPRLILTAAQRRAARSVRERAQREQAS